MDFYNSEQVIAYINQFGAYAQAATFLLFVIQAMAPIFPYIIMAEAGGFLFGFQQGILLAWFGALTGACLAYWMCRWFGKVSFLTRYLIRFGYDEGKLNSRMAFWTIVIARIIPIVPTPLINAIAAWGGVSFPTFLAASSIGKIPTAIIYTGLGIAMFQAHDVKPLLYIIVAALGIMLLMNYIVRRRLRQKHNKTDNSSSAVT